MALFYTPIILRRFRSESDAIVGVEAMISLPILTLIVVGILEFGSVFWQREQIETGLRDAARYMARCRHAEATCQNAARNLAYHGSTSATLASRVPLWNPENSPIDFINTALGSQTIITATTDHQLVNSPLFGFLGIGELTITANHNQRVIGW